MVEKLLTNWMSICLYTFVRVRDAEVDGAPLQGGAGLQTTQPPACMQHVFSHLKPSASFPSVGCIPYTWAHACHLSRWL